MSCNYPLRAYRIGTSDDESSPVGPQDRGRSLGIVFDVKKGQNVLAEYLVPCGKCQGCIQKRVRDWALRCEHEAKMHEFNYFVTLTYDDEHLPDGGSLCYSDFQSFMKKARHWYGIFDWRTKKQWQKTRIRFFMCGEYGALKRPHYHVLLFNFPIPDLNYLKRSPKGSNLYTSELVSELWSRRGFVTIGAVEYASAAYVAQYCVKKMGQVDSDYEFVDLETGETVRKSKEMVQMSRAPGIGALWYEKYGKQVFPVDRCVSNGVQVGVPRFYVKRYAEKNPEGFEEVAFKRYERSRVRLADQAEDRLKAREECLKARNEFYRGSR